MPISFMERSSAAAEHAAWSPLEDEHQVGEKQKQVHRAEQYIGPGRREGERAERECQQEQRRVDGVQSQGDRLSGCVADHQHRRYLQPDARKHGSEQDVHRALRSEEHTSELQSPCNLVCRLLLEKKKKT